MTKIENFVAKRLLTNKRTIEGYTDGINSYFACIKKDPESYFGNGNDYEADVSKYYLENEKKWAPLTLKTRLNAIKQFICTFDKSAKDLDIWETINLRLRGVEPITEEMALSRDDLKKILAFCDVKSKSMFLILASSGMRVESLCGITLNDVKLDETPTRIVLRPEIVKGKKKSVTTFISPEATEALQAWLRVRGNYLRTASLRYTKIPTGHRKGKFHAKKTDDERIFPLSPCTVREIWIHMVEKAGMAKLDTKTNRHSSHPHSLRKFMRSYLGNVDLAEIMMGHKGYLNNAYNRKTDRERAKDYLKCVQNVTIFGATSDEALLKELADMKAKIKLLEDAMQRNITDDINQHPESKRVWGNYPAKSQ